MVVGGNKMKDKWYKKGLVLAIFILFIGAAIIPNISGYLGKTSIQLTNEEITNFPFNEDYVNAYWKLDEGSGNTAFDSSGHGYDGTIYGATWTTGYSGYALNFDGIDDYVDFDDYAEYYPTMDKFFRYSGRRVKYYKVMAKALANTFERYTNLRSIDFHGTLTKEDWRRIFEALYEEPIDTEDFIETFSREADRYLPTKLKIRDQLTEEHRKNLFFGRDNPVESKVYIKIHEKTKLQEKFIKLMNFDASRFSRKQYVVWHW